MTNVKKRNRDDDRPMRYGRAKRLSSRKPRVRGTEVDITAARCATTEN